MKTPLSFRARVALGLIACCSLGLASVHGAFDLGQAKREIEEINRHYCDVLRRGDTAGLMNFFAEDAKSMPSNSPALEGRAKIQSLYDGLVAADLTEMTLTTHGVWGTEAMLAEEGSYIFATKAGAEIDRGKYIVLWKKVGAEWKLFRDAFNSDLPAPPPSFDVKEIHAALQALEQALQAEDREAWVDHYTEDAVFVGEGEPPVSGRAALRVMAREMTPLRDVKLQTQRIEGHGALAYAYIHASWRTTAPSSGTTRVRSLLIWRKDADGRWRIAQELMHADPAK